MKSTHVCEVVPVTLKPHPNADTLSIIEVFGGGYTYVAKTESWVGVEKAAYIPPDNLVPVDRPEFSFLATEKTIEVDGKKYHRIRARKLRGVVSFGLMVPTDEGLGTDCAESLGIIHYDEEIHSGTSKNLNLCGGDTVSAPNCTCVKYDVDSLRKYKDIFKEGELVSCTCKLDGENFRAVYTNGQLYVGSRSQWKKEWTTPPNYEQIETGLRNKLQDKISEEEIQSKLSEVRTKIENFKPQQSKWWQVVRNNPGIEKFCRENPDCVLYGEIFGHTNRLNYGLEDGKIRFRAFDIMMGVYWYSVGQFRDTCLKYNIKVAPLIYEGPYSFEKVTELAEGNSLIEGAKCIREGVVVKAVDESDLSLMNRRCFKVVSYKYLEKVK